jgi:hypothetical protein
VVSVTSRPRFTHGERTPGICWTGGWVGRRADIDTEARRKSLPLLGIKPLTDTILSYSGSIRKLYWEEYLHRRLIKVVLWIKLLVTGRLPRKPVFASGQSMWDSWCTEWHWDRFISKFFCFLRPVSLHRGSPYSYIIWMFYKISPRVVAVQRHHLTPIDIKTGQVADRWRELHKQRVS